MHRLSKTFENITDIIFKFAKKNYNLLNRRKIDIAYDVHKIPFYGKNAEYIKDSKHERGTTHFYWFLTCDIVIAGKRFTIDVIPIHPLDNIENLVDESLQRVKRKIRINRVYLDRGFANSNCIPVLRNNDYIMPIQKNNRIKAWIKKSEGCKARLIEDFEVSKAHFSAVIAFYFKPLDKVLFFEGKIKGKVSNTIKGKGGFGFDPIFIPELIPDKTFAELPLKEKNKISHRGQALKKLLEYLKKK